MRPLLLIGSLLALLVTSGPAVSDVALTGLFVARRECPALQSIRTGSNPGSIAIRPSQTYRLFAKNKPDASYFLIEVEGANPSRRWVAVDCGERLADGAGTGEPAYKGAPAPVPRPSRQAYVLAVSWQPAFCEGRPGKTECRTQTKERFDASNFSLHGLWPQPSSREYCGVSQRDVATDKSGDWDALPAVELGASTRASLEKTMPGTMSSLDRHEWVKHGTCFDGMSADGYFARAIALVDQLNGSKLRSLFASRVGQEVTAEEIRIAVDASFGQGAGDRVRVACKRDRNRSLVIELTIGLAGEIGENPAIEKLIAAARPTSPGCPSGVVDQVGPQ